MKVPALRHSLLLGAFCAGFGILLVLINGLASADIAARATEDRLNSLSQVLPSGSHDNNPLDNTLVLHDAEQRPVTVFRGSRGGQITGVAYEIRASGYAGEIRLMIGVDADGKILGVRVLAHKETPGLGDKIEVKKGDWIQRFDGLWLGHPEEAQWKVRKDGGQFDQFAGATITPRGVVAGVRRGLEFFNANRARLTEVKS